MSQVILRVTQGVELPDRIIPWQDSDGDLIAFGTIPHTFTMKVGNPGAAAVFTKTTGIVGNDVDNVVISFSANELDAVPPGVHGAQLWARRTSDSKDRELPLILIVKASIT